MIHEILSKCHAIPNSKFKIQVDKLKTFVTDEQWREILIFDMALNPVLAKQLMRYINIFETKNINPSMIEKEIKEIRGKTIKLIHEADDIDDVIIKWLKYREIDAYYGFLETIIEGSIIIDYILEGLRKKYANNYLEVLKIIDNLNPSRLTNFSKLSNSIEINLNNKFVKLYIMMKKWQDDQHLFHKTNIMSKYREAKHNFEIKVKKDCPHLTHVNNIYLVALYLLDYCSIIPIELISRFVLGGITNYLSNVIGGKGLGLAILKAYNFNIPKTFVIPVNSLEKKLYIQALPEIEIKKMAIRSSATIEDNEKNSFAGIFKTKLNVKIKDVKDAIEEVYKSLFSIRAKSYIKHFKADKPYMAIVLQEYKDSDIAGVWLGNDLDSGYLEWVKGSGEKLVSGKMTPNREIWDKKSNISNYLKINDDYVGNRCKELQQYINIIGDLEWCIKDDRIIWLQLRPVTRKITTGSSIIKDKDYIYGVPASSGVIRGEPIFLKNLSEKNKFKEGSILLTDYTDPNWVPFMIKSLAIVTAEGGVLSHSAIISRELGIPCVVGIGYEKIDKLKAASKIEVDGSNGVIRILEIKGLN